ncbi:hypothetical protein NHQ30_007916 [Ciborinia camelliae]|nr:hypothetical protein NHQ30_007916 [Ciborinia camelliae]
MPVFARVARPRVRKATLPRSKTGCKSCLSRHIKCDESKPKCRRCVKEGFECIYELVVRPRNGVSHLTIAPKGKVSARPSITFGSSLTLKSPQTSLFEDEAQYRYFDFFKNDNASLLSGYFDTDFWERLILQLCHQEEFVKHAVVALGALAKDMEVDFNVPSSIDARHIAPSEHYLFALGEYSKSLHLARQGTGKTVEEDQLRSLLVSCVLTSIFEFYQGHQEVSLKTIASGLRIISSAREKHMLETPHSKWSLGIDIDLLAVFIRWEQTLLLFMPFQAPFAPHGSLQDREDTKFLDNMPFEFSSLKQARLYWDILNRRVLNWYADCNYQSPEELKDHFIGVHQLSPQPTPTIYPQDVLAYRTADERWTRAFTPILNASRSQPPSSVSYQSATALIIKQLCMRLGLPQITIDRHEITVLSATILDFGVEILEPKNENHDHPQASQRVDDGLVTGLFLVTQKCPDAKMRTRALELLWKHPRRANLYKASSIDEAWFVVGTGKEPMGWHTRGAWRYIEWPVELLEWSVRRRRKHFRPMGEWIS